MTLTQYFKRFSEQGSKTYLKNKIALECGVTEATVNRWLSGQTVPSKLCRERIAQILIVPVKELFPTTTQYEQ